MTAWDGPGCAGCGRAIEPCRGIDADWMHSHDHREACAAGGVARLESFDQWDERRRSKVRRARGAA